MDQESKLVRHAREATPGRVLELLVDETRMHAFLSLRLGEDAKPLDLAAIVEFLRRTGLSDPGDLRLRVGMTSGSVDRVPIAEGRPAQAGRDGEVAWSVAPPAKIVADAEARIDFRAVTQFVKVSAGQTLCCVKDPQPGTPGRDVFGRELPAAMGRQVTLRLGRNVRFEDDGRTVVSLADGCLRVAGDTVSVEDTCVVKEDVDFGIGNIDFNGVVVVNGSVRDGFSVKATKDIIVRGTACGATLEAGGDIRITGGVSGHDKGVLRAHGEVAVRYLDNVTVAAGADIHVQMAIMNSAVEAAGSVVVDRGRIIGGKITAGGDVKASVLGSDMCIPTAIRAGMDLKATARFEQLGEELANVNAQARKIEVALGSLVDDPARIDKLPPEKGDAVRKLITQLEQKLSRAAELDKELASLSPGGQSACVAVGKRLFPNVTVQIGRSLVRCFDEELAGPVTLRVQGVEGTVEASRGV